jgi:flagellar basal body rod protein FlgG
LPFRPGAPTPTGPFPPIPLVAQAVLTAESMNVGLYQAAAGMKATAQWQEMVAENLSSSFIPGYKKQTLAFGAVEAGLMGPSSTTINGASRKFALTHGTQSTDFQSGDLKPTGVATDLAIEGPGFFEVQLPNGAKAYTRDGEFHPNAQGQLVTKQGHIVQGLAGPIQLDPNHATPVTISASGDVSQGGNVLGTVKVMEFNNYNRLEGLGGGLFQATDPALVSSLSSKVSLHQGYLESANTSTVAEMANLITSSRMFEANQKVIQSEDERMAKLIADVGNPT